MHIHICIYIYTYDFLKNEALRTSKQSHILNGKVISMKRWRSRLHLFEAKTID